MRLNRQRALGVVGTSLLLAFISAEASGANILSLVVEGPNQASDENREYLIDRNFTVTGQIDVGDSLRGIFNINTLNSTAANVGGDTGNNELSGIYQGLVIDKIEASPGVFEFVLSPDPAFEADICGGQADCALAAFAPGPGALVVMFEDSTPDYASDFSNPPPATPPGGPDDGTLAQTVPPSSADVSVGPYATEEAFSFTATNGGHFWTLGFTGPGGDPGPGEGWQVISTGFGENILNAFSVTSATAGALFNMGASRLANNPGIGDSVTINPVTPSPFGGSVEFAVSGGIKGVINLDTPFEASSNLDVSFNSTSEVPPLACRLTGGGVITEDEILVWDGTYTDAEDGPNTFQIGGQVGARTALHDPESGEWNHHQQKGPAGMFNFHCGTSSAVTGTEILEIRCSDPGGCAPSGNPPSPNKQIDFDCIGHFERVGSGRNEPNFIGFGANVDVGSKGKGKGFDGTLHAAFVNVDDLGEGPDGPTSDTCPLDGYGEKGTPTPPEGANCDCSDFYRITILDGLNAGSVPRDADGRVTAAGIAALQAQPVIYEVKGYLKAGNGLQLHEVTGFDR